MQSSDHQAETPQGDANSVSFQSRVRAWVEACFGAEIANDRDERNHRFLEEALELVQSLGCRAEDAHALVDYVFGRPAGEVHQEVGGVAVTFDALCSAHSLDREALAEAELARVWKRLPDIRAKQHTKPAIGPLPGVYPKRPAMPEHKPKAPASRRKLSAAQAAVVERMQQGWELASQNGVAWQRANGIDSGGPFRKVGLKTLEALIRAGVIEARTKLRWPTPACYTLTRYTLSAEYAVHDDRG